MKNIVILDVETTGANHLIDEVCQMSYIVLGSDLSIVEAKNFFFMVDYVNFKSDKKKLNIDELKSLSNNKTFKDQYKEIFNDLNNNFIVCHKCEHDISFVKSEFMRCDNKNNFVYEEFCTMKYYTDILKIPSEKFGYKYPKLIEVMPFLNIKRGDIYSSCKQIFNLTNEITFHDSRVDVASTYLVAIKTGEIINRYKDYLNKSINNTQINKHENLEDNINNSSRLAKKNDAHTDNANERDMSLFKSLFSFKGKIDRNKYICYVLLTAAMYMLANIIIDNIYTYSFMSDNTSIIISVLLWVINGFGLTALTVKRIRYNEESMWLIFLLLIPIINLIFVLHLSIKKDIETINTHDMDSLTYRNKKLKKISYISICILIATGIYTSYEIYGIIKQEQAIDIVMNTLYDKDKSSTKTIATYIEEKVEDINPYYIDDWYAVKIDSNTYLVTFDFDIEDDYYSNGYNSYPYEVNIDTKEVTEISSDKMIKKYEDMGQFDDRLYINEFKIEKSM